MIFKMNIIYFVLIHITLVHYVSAVDTDSDEDSEEDSYYSEELEETSSLSSHGTSSGYLPSDQYGIMPSNSPFRSSQSSSSSVHLPNTELTIGQTPNFAPVVLRNATNCENEVFGVYDRIPSPRRHFITSFRSFDLEYFNNRAIPDSVYDYYEDLLTKADFQEETRPGVPNLWSPHHFCVTKYPQWVESCLKSLEMFMKVPRAVNGINAMRVLYHNHRENITDEILFGRVFNLNDPRTRENIRRRYPNAAGRIRKFFQQHLRVVREIRGERFISVKQFCIQWANYQIPHHPRNR